MGLACLVLAGCGKDEKAVQQPPPPHAPENYMNDPEFRGKLAEARKTHLKLIRDRNVIADKMQAKIEALRERLKTSDDAKIKAELEKDPEWQELYKQCQEANAKVKAQRQEALGAVRSRLTPPTTQKKTTSNKDK